MHFPEVQRVIYTKNPLDRVICHLRFPPILKIDTTEPTDFQEGIREVFPNYSVKNEMAVDFPEEFVEEIPMELFHLFGKQSKNKNYEFEDEDENWKINLTRTFIAFSCSKYERWELFRDKIQQPLKTFVDIYRPS